MTDLDKFESKVKTHLDEQVQNLNAETRQLLATARKNALNQPIRKSWLKNWQQFWLPAGSLAICGLLAVFFLVNPKLNNGPASIASNQTQQQISDQVATLELLIDAGDDEEAIDPDFYLWADEILAIENAKNSV